MPVSSIPMINLLPWREARLVRRRRLFCISLGAAVLLALVVIAGAIMLAVSMVTEREQINIELREDIALLQQRAITHQSVVAGHQKQQADFTRTRQLHAARIKQTRLLATLMRMMPEGLRLSALRYDPPAIQIRGSAVSAHHVSGWRTLLEERRDIANTELQALYLDQQSAPAMPRSYLYQIRLELNTAELRFAPPEEET